MYPSRQYEPSISARPARCNTRARVLACVTSIIAGVVIDWSKEDQTGPRQNISPPMKRFRDAHNGLKGPAPQTCRMRLTLSAYGPGCKLDFNMESRTEQSVGQQSTEMRSFYTSQFRKVNVIR